jgi:YrbI family 3-deoxy-D-manno-octulosonate 8-phosphate phosphatase
VSGIDPGLARGIRLVVLDVDGVLTDNELFIGEAQGERIELKRFNVQDGVGIHLLRFASIPVAILSGRQSAATTHGPVSWHH